MLIKNVSLHITNILVPSCEELNLENGEIDYSESLMPNGRYPVTARANFTCNYGYNLNGSASSSCLDSLNWSEQIPICDQGNDFFFDFFIFHRCPSYKLLPCLSLYSKTLLIVQKHISGENIKAAKVANYCIVHKIKIIKNIFCSNL